MWLWQFVDQLDLPKHTFLIEKLRDRDITLVSYRPHKSTYFTLLSASSRILHELNLLLLGWKIESCHATTSLWQSETNNSSQYSLCYILHSNGSVVNPQIM